MKTMEALHRNLSWLIILFVVISISIGFIELLAELQRREARVRRLVDANIIGIFVWDLEARIVEANDAFLRMVGYDREDLVSDRMRTLTPAELHARDERARAELKATGTVQPYEKQLFRKDGGLVPVLVGGALFEESGNEGVGFVVDLTERKRAEEALGKRSEVQRLCRSRFRLAVGIRSGLQIHAVDRECIRFRPSASDWDDVLGSRSRR